MTTQRYHGAVPLQPHELQRLLRRQLRRGLRASRLLDCSELISFLCADKQKRPTAVLHELVPADLSPDVFDRAMEAERQIAEAVARIGGKPAQALTILCGLDDGTVGLSFQQRRKLAGQVLGTTNRPVSAATFVKNYEPGLVRDLAVEVWRECCDYGE